MRKNITHRLSIAFKTAKIHSPSVYQHFLQYKLIYRRTVTNSLLKKMKITNSDLCHSCKETETIEHAYLNCTNTVRLWVNSIAWVRDIHDPHFAIALKRSLAVHLTTKLQICSLSVSEM